jgi:hypothetical protein
MSSIQGGIPKMIYIELYLFDTDLSNEPFSQFSSALPGECWDSNLI